MKQKNKGITLIALIITIIVLLILAGVTINLTLGNNGIFKVAKQAARNYKEAEEKELGNLEDFANTINNTINKVTAGSLVSQVTENDYGKTINYNVTVDGTTLNNWRIFYNDGINVYIILADYLDASLVPSETGLNTDIENYEYNVWSSTNRENLLNAIKTEQYWLEFASGVEGATAIGSPTNEMFVNSWNKNPIVNTTKLTVNDVATGLADPTGLYIPQTKVIDECYGYWFSSIDVVDSERIFGVFYDGNIGGSKYYGKVCGVRPVVCLPANITGTISSNTVTMYY